MEDIKHDRMANVLRKALQNEFGVENDEDIEVYDINESPGSGVSDNFGGELKLVKFKFKIRNQQQEKEHSYFVKSLPKNPLVKDMLESVI